MRVRTTTQKFTEPGANADGPRIAQSQNSGPEIAFSPILEVTLAACLMLCPGPCGDSLAGAAAVPRTAAPAGATAGIRGSEVEE
jgi:hypothetical protein